MIHSFTTTETEAIWNLTFTKRVDPLLAQRARVKLQLLDAAETIDDLRVPPGNRLEKLTGDRAGKHSIRVNSQWRLCSRWNQGAHDVELVDYH